MKSYKVSISAVTDYMQHRMDDMTLEDWEKQRGGIIERKDVAKEDYIRAEFHAYKDEKGYYMPSDHIIGALINAGAMVKSKVGNAKKSMKNIVAGMFSLLEDKIRLPDNYVIDKRSGVNRAIKARIIIIRPKWQNWKANFTLLVDNDTITLQTIKNIIESAGMYIGIGSFSPRCNGSFGRFKLDNITQVS